MLRRFTLAAAVTLAALTGCFLFEDRGTFPRTEWRSRLPAGIERVFIGPEYFANRLFDWRLAGGRIECVEGSASKPMRTLQHLQRRVELAEGGFTARVRTGPLATGSERHEHTWSGFLIGVGGPDVDHRTSALVHHWPAPGGGLIAALDGTGRLVLRDNEGTAGGPRAARADLGLEHWPLLASSPGPGLTREQAGDVELRLMASPGERGHRIVLSALAPDTGAELARLELDGIARERLEGNLALVSHASAAGKGPGYWFRDWRLEGRDSLERRDERSFGPILASMYTLDRGVLKLTAQMAALGPDDTRTAELQVLRTPGKRDWETVAKGELDPTSWTVPFRVEPWDGSRDWSYRVNYALVGADARPEEHTWEGTVRAEPTGKDELVLAALSCMAISTAGDGSWTGTGFWFPHADLARNLAAHDPDVLFFAGDQIYESGLAGVVRRPLEKALLDYQYHWYDWCWAFRELTRDRPTVCLPDDHDVYHGNLWGAGGRAAEGPLRPQGDNGGYVMDPVFVNAVHRTQTSHLPDPVDPAPALQDISVYFTDWNYAGVSFAILADRQWKDSASVLVPDGRVRNGWFQNREFDVVAGSDVPGAPLLGERQEAFLERWVADWSGGARMKAVLSQTIFANVATLPAEALGDGVVPGLAYAGPGEYVEGDELAADTDSNGWPRSARDRALRILRKGFPVHIAGDQHLPSLSRYGVEEHGDAPWAFCVPAVANLWPRRWYPPGPGANRAPDAPAYTGDFIDGFGNRVSVHAVANPRISGHEPAALMDRMPGYGIVRFDKPAGRVTFECWPRWSDPRDPDAVQYEGWPLTVDMRDNYARTPYGMLPPVEVRGLDEPVVQVVQESTGELVYALRLRGASLRLPVFEAGSYTLHVGEPDTERWRSLTGLAPGDTAPVRVDLGAEDAR